MSSRFTSHILRRGPNNSENNSQEYLNNLIKLIRMHQIIDSIGSRQCGKKSLQFKLKGPDISEKSLNMSEQFSLCAKHSLRTCKTHTLNVRTCWDCHSSSQGCYLSLYLNLFQVVRDSAIQDVSKALCCSQHSKASQPCSDAKFQDRVRGNTLSGQEFQSMSLFFNSVMTLNWCPALC